MEYLEGESLADAIDHEHLRPDEIRRLLRQICGALAATHRVGIVHRDLKPENIWIARPPHAESYVKLLDFGIAKLLDPTRTNLTQTGAVMGTPLYMSPEQCLGREIGASTDVYAMGVLLYRIFAGRHPFTGTVTTELALKHVSEAPLPPSRFRPLPAGLEGLILDCLAKDPAARPASAEILGARLEEALAAWPEHGAAPVERDAGAVLSTAPAGLSRRSMRDERTLPMAGRRPGRGPWLWLAVGLAVVGVGVGAWLLHRGPEAGPVSRPAEPLAPLPETKPVPVSPSAAPVAPVAVPQPPEEKRGVAHAGGRAHLGEARTVGRSAAARRAGPTAGYPLPSLARPAEAKPEAADLVPPAKPAPEEMVAPLPRPTRAQQRGLLDDNPLRR